MDDRVDAETLKDMLHVDKADFRYKDLSGATLNGNLLGVDFRGANLRGATVGSGRHDAYNTHINNVDFRGANLDGMHFIGSDYSAHYGVHISDTTFDKGQLSRIGSMLNVHVYSQDWSGVDLSRCTLKILSMHSVNLQGAQLGGADFTKSRLNNVNFTRASLRNANLAGSEIRKMSFYEADLRGADLSQADMTDADLRGALFDGPELSCEGLCLDGAKVDKDLAAKITVFAAKPPQGLIVDKEYTREAGDTDYAC